MKLSEEYVRALAMENATRLVTSTEYMTMADGTRVMCTLADVFMVADEIAHYIKTGEYGRGI